MNISEIIKSEREKKSISLTELSEKTEIPEYILNRLENDEAYASQDPYGRLYAKKVLNFFGIDFKENKEKSEEIVSDSPSFQTKILDVVVNLVPHTLAVFVMMFFLYANATFSIKNPDVKVNQILEKIYDNQKPNEQTDTQKTVDHIVLESEGDVWITLSVDGEKKIINLKEGETKTIYFNEKISFETIGNADKLKIIFDGQEVKISGREIIHNVFVDSEGVFYNGYNVLRGVPKI
ncbi:MAG: helix-turn-helix domain-containing protein [Sulfurihydrogenibium sp.]